MDAWLDVYVLITYIKHTMLKDKKNKYNTSICKHDNYEHVYYCETSFKYMDINTNLFSDSVNIVLLSEIDLIVYIREINLKFHQFQS